MKISLHTKILLKGLFHSILQLSFIIAIGWLFDKLFEIAIIYCCFFIFRSTFEKQYHALTMWLCTLYTFIVFFVVTKITPRKELSLILIVAFTFTINFISFHLREYLDIKARVLKVKGVKICKGISKEQLQVIIDNINLTDIEIKILAMFYCERKSITYIANHLSYSYDRIWQVKNEALQVIKEFQK